MAPIGRFALVTHHSKNIQHRGPQGAYDGHAPDPGQDRQRTLKLVQLSDSHLFADPSGKLLGLTTRRSFEAVLARIMGSAATADALVMTGDLVHDETPEGYAFLGRSLESTGLPCYCIPGNHDRRDLMEEWLGTVAVERVASRTLGGWNLILLDSTKHGNEVGHLGHHQLDQLDELLTHNPRPSLVFLHQHPMAVQSRWIDTMGVDNGKALLATCDRRPNLKAVVFGHVHQEFRATHNGYLVLGTPSTCIQFLPGSADFAMDSRTPGYREFLLHPDGSIETSVIRLTAYPEPLPLHGSGY